MTDINEAKKLIGYCGIYCGKCGMYKGRIIAKVADDLKELIGTHGYPEWVPKFGGIDFKFAEFQKGLAYFTKESSGCYCQEPCKAGGGVPGCKIKECAKEKGIEICFQCDKFPCKTLSKFFKNHPDYFKECERFKKLGMEEWLKLQIQEAEEGYCQVNRKYYTKPKPKS